MSSTAGNDVQYELNGVVFSIDRDSWVSNWNNFLFEEKWQLDEWEIGSAADQTTTARAIH